MQKRIVCPTCRTKHDPKLRINQLSKNYIAHDLACKEREMRKKMKFCDEHTEVYLELTIIIISQTTRCVYLD